MLSHYKEIYLFKLVDSITLNIELIAWALQKYSTFFIYQLLLLVEFSDVQQFFNMKWDQRTFFCYCWTAGTKCGLFYWVTCGVFCPPCCCPLGLSCPFGICTGICGEFCPPCGCTSEIGCPFPFGCTFGVIGFELRRKFWSIWGLLFWNGYG